MRRESGGGGSDLLFIASAPCHGSPDKNEPVSRPRPRTISNPGQKH